MKHLLKLMMALFLSNSAVANTMESVTPQEAAALFNEQKTVIVDVREDNEWAAQHIDGAIHIPLGQLADRLSELAPYKNSSIVTQCRSGKRSASALEILKLSGFKKVYNMDGGIQAWEKAGLPTQ